MYFEVLNIEIFFIKNELYIDNIRVYKTTTIQIDKFNFFNCKSFFNYRKICL